MSRALNETVNNSESSRASQSTVPASNNTTSSRGRDTGIYSTTTQSTNQRSAQNNRERLNGQIHHSSQHTTQRQNWPSHASQPHNAHAHHNANHIRQQPQYYQITQKNEAGYIITAGQDGFIKFWPTTWQFRDGRNQQMMNNNGGRLNYSVPTVSFCQYTPPWKEASTDYMHNRANDSRLSRHLVQWNCMEITHDRQFLYIGGISSNSQGNQMPNQQSFIMMVYLLDVRVRLKKFWNKWFELEQNSLMPNQMDKLLQSSDIILFNMQSLSRSNLNSSTTTSISITCIKSTNYRDSPKCHLQEKVFVGCEDGWVRMLGLNKDKDNAKEREFEDLAKDENSWMLPPLDQNGHHSAVSHATQRARKKISENIQSRMKKLLDLSTLFEFQHEAGINDLCVDPNTGLRIYIADSKDRVLAFDIWEMFEYKNKKDKEEKDKQAADPNYKKIQIKRFAPKYTIHNNKTHMADNVQAQHKYRVSNRI